MPGRRDLVAREQGYREGAPLQRWSSDAVPIVKETLLSQSPARGSIWVALASVAVLFLVSTVYWLDFRGLAPFLFASRETVFDQGEYWRLATSIAVHADFRHFLSNGIVFGVLSLLIYGYFGATVYPMATWLLGCLVTALSLATYPPTTRLIGASGVVYLMAGFWLTLYLFIERRMSFGKRLLRALGFGLIVLVPSVWEPSVSYRTHGIGFGIGMIFAIAHFFRKKADLRKAERVEWDWG